MAQYSYEFKNKQLSIVFIHFLFMYNIWKSLNICQALVP